MAENLAELAPPDLDDDVIRKLDRPIHATGGLTILKGSLAPEGAVVKTAGFDDSVFTAPPGSSTASAPRWTRSSAARSRPATSW